MSTLFICPKYLTFGSYSTSYGSHLAYRGYSQTGNGSTMTEEIFCEDKEVAKRQIKYGINFPSKTQIIIDHKLIDATY